MDMYTASLMLVTAVPSDLPRLASLGVWEVMWSVMGQSHLQLTITDDYGALVPVPYLYPQPTEH